PELAGIDEPGFAQQMDTAQWPELKQALAAVFARRTRAEWCELLAGTDACVAPVLNWDEAPQHPHNQARQTFVEIDGVVQPAAAPRFSRTPSQARSATETSSRQLLTGWGVETSTLEL